MPAIITALFESPNDINPADLAKAAYEAMLEEEAQKLVIKAREYHAGESFDAELSTKLEQFVIGGDVSDIKGLNLARKVVNAALRRLQVESFDVEGLGEETGETAADEQQKWIDAFWKANRMDTKQRRIHRQTLVDGEAFVLVAYDDDLEMATVHPHQRYTDTLIDGDGYGCKAHYPNDDISQPMSYASKRWMETYYERQVKKTRKRMTLYYPNAIYKYAHNGVDWSPWTDYENEPWPIPWTGEDGKGLGIAVIHFANPEERPEAMDAFGPQVASDHALVDLMGAAALSAFRIYKVFGFYPTSDGQAPADDGSNKLKLQPGTMVGTDKKTKSEADFAALESGDLTQLQNLINELFVWTAIVTETPVSEFSASGQVAAEGTLKQQEVALLARVQERQEVFGDAWEDVIKMARKLTNIFGGGSFDESLEISTTWKDAQTRSEQEIREAIKAKAETGVTWKQLMIEWGYSADQIEVMEASEERKAIVDSMAMLGQINDESDNG
jgi:hypothetical protein